MERYQSLCPLGEGSYGAVVKCRHRDSGRLVAIKKFLDSDDDHAVKKIALREIKLLRKLRHDNLVNLLEAWKRRRRWYLVFEFVERTLLDDLEQNPSGLDLDTGRRYLFQVLRAATFCHQHNIIHRDIKPENVLISLGGVVKLCDFGFARTVSSPADGAIYTDYVATRWYRAPELLVGDAKYGKPVDVWAIGCLLIEMLTAQPLFPGDSDLDQIHHIIRCFGNLTPHHQEVFRRNPVFSGVRLPECFGPISLKQRFRSVSLTALDLAQSCLEVDPEDRAQCSELLVHQLFTRDSFHIRFVDELNAKIQKGHRENATLPKITKTPRQEHDEGDERKHRARDKKPAEDVSEKVNKDRTKGKTKTKLCRAPCNASEPSTKPSKPVETKVPGQSHAAPKIKQGKVTGSGSSRSSKPLTSDPTDPPAQRHERADEFFRAREHKKSIVSRAPEENPVESSTSSNSEQNPAFHKSRHNTKVPKASAHRLCLRPNSDSDRRTTNQSPQESSAGPTEDTKITSEYRARVDNNSQEVKPSSPKLSKTTKPNQSSSSSHKVPLFHVLPRSYTALSEPSLPPQRPANPNASRNNHMSTRLTEAKELIQSIGDNQTRPSSVSRDGVDTRQQPNKDHQEDQKWNVRTRAQTMLPPGLSENPPERRSLPKTQGLSDKENHQDPASSAPATTTCKSSVDGLSSGSWRGEKCLSHFDLVVKSLNPGSSNSAMMATTQRVARANAGTDVGEDPTAVVSTWGHQSSTRTSVRPHGATSTRQNQQLPLSHVGGPLPCRSDPRDLRVGGSSIAVSKTLDPLPGFEKTGGTRGREQRRQTEQKQQDGPAQG